MSNESTAVERTADDKDLKNVLPTEKEAAAMAAHYSKTSWFGYFFTILPQEWKRLSLMISMFVLIAFTYTFLRIFKDRIVYSVLDNTETKHWLKLLCFLVTQFLVIFAQNITSKSNFSDAFASLTLYFAGILGLNTVFIFFNKYLPIFGNDTFADSLFVASRLECRGLVMLYPLVLVFNFFPYSIFYILAEVIGSMMVSFCFMTYINNVSTQNQNKRFFKVLYFFSNIASFLSGQAANLWTESYKNSPKKECDAFFYIFTICAIVCYLLVLVFKKFLEKELENKIVIVTAAPKKTGSKKRKVTFKDSLGLMFNSKFLLYMSLLSCFYNVCANLLESSNGSGMAASALFYTQEKSFYASSFKSLDASCTSLLTCGIIISPLCLIPDMFGIGLFASVPLVVSLIGAIIQLFFAMANYSITGSELAYPFNKFGEYLKFDESTRYILPYVESYASTIIQTAIKVSKYAFYDIIKEAISMKIDPELRPLFKGVFDGSIAKFGKSLGSLYGIIMFAIFKQKDARAYFPYTAIIIFIFCYIWVKAIKYLSASFRKAQASDTFIDPDLTSEIKLI